MTIPKAGLLLPILGMFVGCAAPMPTTFSGQCILQPVAAQDGLMLVNAVCERKE